MPDALSAEERAAIEAAAREGRVRRVAPGTTGEVRWVWCPKAKRLVERDAPADRAGSARRRPAWWAGRHRSEEVKLRRQRLRALAAQGLSGPQIAAELGCSTSVVYRDCEHMGIRLKRRGER